jgi:hypothetical protein
MTYSGMICSLDPGPLSLLEAMSETCYGASAFQTFGVKAGQRHD